MNSKVLPEHQSKGMKFSHYPKIQRLIDLKIQFHIFLKISLKTRSLTNKIPIFFFSISIQLSFCLNLSYLSSLHRKKKKKEHGTNLTSIQPHIELFPKCFHFLRSMLDVSRNKGKGRDGRKSYTNAE